MMRVQYCSKLFLTDRNQLPDHIQKLPRSDSYFNWNVLSAMHGDRIHWYYGTQAAKVNINVLCVNLCPCHRVRLVHASLGFLCSLLRRNFCARKIQKCTARNQTDNDEPDQSKPHWRNAPRRFFHKRLTGKMGNHPIPSLKEIVVIAKRITLVGLPWIVPDYSGQYTCKG